IAPALLKHVNKIWEENPEEGKNLLSFFIEKGMNLSAKQSYNNAVMIAIERDNLGMLLQLLKSGANANIAIRPETDETCNFIKTPFMTATGRKNFEAMKILLDFGADPYLPEKEYRKAYGSNDDVEILATTRNTNDISPFTGDGAEEYTIKCHSFIQNYFLEKITLQLSQIAHESKSYGQEIVTTSTNEIKEEASPVIEEIPSNVDISANVDETLNKYSDYLQEAALDTRLPDFQQIQCQFDSLLLDFVQTSREDTLTKLWELLDRNPDLHGYSITTLINKKTGVEIAKDVLATTPKTLDEFFRQKKQQIEGREKVDTNSEEKTLGPNIYKILSKYGESFFKIANNCWEFAKKYSAKFEKMHFISPNSEGEIGIKHYNDGLVKMKLATNCDDALCCTKIFVNNDTNQKLYLFDEIKNHNEVSKAGVVTYTGMDGDVFDDMVYGK
ncbi:MAG: hypothetical protein KA998_05110, partial [Rickettsiaceae bacterium]|nr:hypothetical protein [Rickettsiaceae bacterium]